MALPGVGLDSAITFQNSFHHFDSQAQSRLVFEQSNHAKPAHFEEMPNEQKRAQIKSRGWIKLFVKMDARTVEVENTGRAAGFSAGALVFHAVTEIDPNPPTGFAQTQAQVDIGLALPIPVI